MNSIAEPQYTYFITQRGPADSLVVETRAEPTQMLARLVAILHGLSARQPAPHIAEQEAGQYVISQAAILAMQGADGDPEMEWEDVAGQWAAHPEVRHALAKYELTQLIDLIDQFRALVGVLPEGQSIYCRQTS